MEIGAVILCGGKSTRMGRDKASLPFGNETMLQRVVRLLSNVVPRSHMVVVAAAGQVVPALPSEIRLTHDEHPERGPLEGLAAGLQAMPTHVDAVYATSCDVPLLVPGFVRRLFELLAETGGLPACDIVVPREDQHHHPLAAVYRRPVLAAVQQLLATGQRRPRFLFDAVRTREVDVDELRSVDPALDTLKNLNTPDEYQAALQSAGSGDCP